MPTPMMRKLMMMGKPNPLWWYRKGGAVPSVVYMPFYARSLAYSYKNVVNPGTLDAYVTPGGYTDPNVVLNQGWTWDATDSLRCDASISETSCFVALATASGQGGGSYGHLFGSQNNNFLVMPNTADGTGYFKNVNATLLSMGGNQSTQKVFTMAGKVCYINGTLIGTAGAGIATDSYFCLGNKAAGGRSLGGTLHAFALYASLSAAQITAVTAALLSQYANPPAHSTKIISGLGTSIMNAANSFLDRVGWIYNESWTTVDDHSAAGARITVDLDGQVVAAAGDGANVIIIEMGVNDDNGGNMAALQAEAEENIAEIKGTNPGAPVFWMCLPAYVSNAPGAAQIDKSNIRTAIAAACIAQGATYWDTLSTPWIDSTDTSDGTHPTAAGHAKVATQILALL